MSTYDCPTVFISNFFDILSPLVQELLSFIKDTPQFLQIIKDFEFPGNSNHNPLLFTMDVSSLYTSTPLDGALEASKHFLDKHNNKSISMSTILQLIELVLKMNTFHSMANNSLRNKVLPWDLVMLAYSWDTWMNCFLLSMNTTQILYKRYIDNIIEAASCSENNYDVSLIMWQTSNRLSTTHKLFQTTHTLSLTFS